MREGEEFANSLDKGDLLGKGPIAFRIFHAHERDADGFEGTGCKADAGDVSVAGFDVDCDSSRIAGR